ncbi:MAG TPA: FixH family protein [Vicinamibacterales bacterium]|nr:FixH family protein [Vicinamibacterales bacterium]
MKASRGELSQAIRTVGVVRSDETRVVDVNVKIEGWIRELTADYTGRFVRQGEPLLTLYSPDLLATEQEYVLALGTRDQLQSSVMPDAKTRADALVAAARQRLVLWDLAPAELRELDETRTAKDALVVRAPTSGFVIDKAVVKGAHVTPGQMLFKLADLSVVWVEADVYEQDLPLMRVGARATVVLDAYPGESTTGRVIYISPYVDEQTRTDKVRYEFPNPRGQLKPGMFATVEIATSGGTGITVPVDAVLDSGRDQVVFVAEGDGHFTPRPVTVGRRLGGTVEILKGLKEGEEVASGAAFFLDSESQLRGALQGYVPISPSPTTGSGQDAERPKITLRTIPDPPRTGETQFEVTVADSKGVPLADAEVTVQLFMPAMPTMNMPAMRNELKLPSAGNGVYRGTGQVMMAGRWEATVIVTRGGQRVGSLQTPVVAR